MDMKRFEGLTVEDLKAAIVAMEEAEEAMEEAEEAMKAAEEAKREAKLDEARLAMLDAAVQYLLLLGAIDEEEVRTMDVSKTLDDLKEAEGQLAQYAKFFKMMKELPFDMPKVKVRVSEVDNVDNDIEVLEKFLRTI